MARTWIGSYRQSCGEEALATLSRLGSRPKDLAEIELLRAILDETRAADQPCRSA